MLKLNLAMITMVFGASLMAEDKKPTPLPENAQKELKQLQGKWVLKSLARADNREDVKGAKIELEIKGNKWIFAGKEKAVFIAFDPTSDPKCVDLKSVERGRDGQVDEAIYRLDGDTLTICLHQAKAKSRPTKFEASIDRPDDILAVFVRAKAK